METSTPSFKLLGLTAKHLARRILAIGENRLELLAVEVREERERLVRAILLALGVAVFGLLAALTLTAALTVWLWNYSPGVLLLTLSALHGTIGVILYRRLTARMRDWLPFSDSLDQLRKDRECLEKHIA